MESGLYTDEYQLRADSGLLEYLSFWDDIDVSGPADRALESYKVKGWNRPTISWNIECDADGYSRQ